MSNELEFQIAKYKMLINNCEMELKKDNLIETYKSFVKGKELEYMEFLHSLNNIKADLK